MVNMKNSSPIIKFDEEMNRLIFLCARIDQIASNIRTIQLSNLTCSNQNTETHYDSLLFMAEHIEGSAILLESLLAKQHRNCVLFEKKISQRICYTRCELLELRRRVTSTLSHQVRNLLEEVVERESNDSVTTERKSWRNIRTILI